VKAVATHLVALVQITANGIAIGMGWQSLVKGVSNTATCGTCGKRRRASSMRGDWRGCAGAQGDQVADCRDHVVIDQAGDAKRSPPCTTR